MFPYTLLSDGHMLEPEEDPAPLFPWLVPQPPAPESSSGEGNICHPDDHACPPFAAANAGASAGIDIGDYTTVAASPARGTDSAQKPGTRQTGCRR